MAVREIRVKPDDWEQWLATPDGPQLVVAGPGTGKTEFLVHRVVHLLESGTARRDEVAVLTFSRRAAADIRNRIETAVGGSGMPIESSTFHSLALRMLEHGSGDRPIPLTTPEQVGVVADLLSAEDPADWPVTYRGILDTPGFAAEIADFLMRCSERLLSPEDLEERALSRADWRGIPQLFSRYRQRLVEIGRTDYGTLLVSATHFLEGEPGQALAGHYRYIVVDEYQDTSPAQATIADLLARPHRNLTVAGDPYQSVYSFRGAEVRNIARFQESNPDALRLVLDESFRVPKEILDSALRVVSSGELPGAAGPVEPAPHPGRVEAYVFDQETAEAEWIAREVQHAVRVEGTRLADIAILVRSKREMLNELSRALDRRGLPHDPPQRRLVDHAAVRFVHDLVMAVTKGGPISSTPPSDAFEADRAMRRVLLGPVFGLPLGQEREILRQRRRSRAGWSEVLTVELGDHDDLIDLLTDPQWATVGSAVDGFWRVWTDLKALESIVTDPSREEWRFAFTSFSQVLDRQAERDPRVTLERFFELVEEEDFEATPLLSPTPPAGRITLTTLHQAKGLEYDIVFIANAVEGVFPDLRRSRRMLRPELLSPERMTDPEAQHVFQIQEEMRLAYTAMTRASKRVIWTATDAGVDQGEHRPSRFLRAAAGPDSAIGPPGESQREPVTVGELETALRRSVLDPAAATVDRLAAVRVLAESPSGAWAPTRFAGVPTPGPDKPILPEQIRLSPSQADSYATCPRKYALERRLRLVNADSPYAQFGTLVHSALERAETSAIGTDRCHADVNDAIAALREIWDDEANFGTPELDQAWLDQAIAGVTKLYEKWPSHGKPIALETKVESEIGGVHWMGVIDRLERTEHGLKVVDYKTGKTPPSVPDAAESIQLAFYADAATVEYGQPVTEAEMWFPRARAVSVTTRELDIDRLDQIRELMETITSEILAEKWEPKVGARCGRCEFRLSCPVWPEGRGAFLP